MTIYCCVARCRASSNNGARLFKIPTFEEQPLVREMWLKNLNVAGQTPELLFICEKHISIQNENEQSFKSVVPCNSEPIKIDDEDITEENREMHNDKADLQMSKVHPNNEEKSNECIDVYEILANLHSEETSGLYNIVTENLGPAEVETPATDCNIVFTNPFLESNTAIELESSENDNVDVNKMQCLKAVPLQNLLKNEKDKNVNNKKRTKHLKGNRKVLIESLMNDLKKTMNTSASPEEQSKKPLIETINIDSSDDEIQEIKQPENSSVIKDVAQENEQSKSSEVLMLEEKLQMARKRVSEVSQELHRIEGSLKQVFNADQIRRLKEKRKGTFKWKAKTLKKALQLFFTCGESGYKCLLNNNHPLPSLNVLRRIIFDFKVGSGVLGKTYPVQKSNVKYVQEIIDSLFVKQMKKTIVL